MEHPPQFDERALERARIARDPRFDGRFFVAVVTTGVYCRPICPAPTPRRANVRYFATAAAAQEAGFRPCLRCRPEAAPGAPAWIGAAATVRRALRLIDEGALDRGGVEDLAARLGVGARQLDRLFARHVGASPLAVAATRRLHFAKRLVDETNLPIADVAAAAGYRSARRFNDAFLRAFRRAPRELRRARRAAPAEARGELALRLAFRPSYDWASILAFLAARATPGVESVEDGAYARTLRVVGAAAALSVRPAGAGDALELRLRAAAPRALEGLLARVRRMFDLDADPASIAATFRGDPLLAPLARRRPGLRLPGAADPFELAVRAVLGQQITVAAARTLAGRLAERFGAPFDGGPRLTRLFPDAAALAAADLSAIGLTNARAAALRGLARAVRDGAVDFDADAEAVRAQLLALPGIGPWTADYVLLRGLGEPDACPCGDLALRRALEPGRTATPREVAARAEAWRPWRGYAVFHLWAAAADAAGRKKPPKARATRRAR